MARRHRNARPIGRDRDAPDHAGSVRVSGHFRANGSPKVGFSSAGEAHSVADEISADGGIALVPYRCGHCGSWHLGSVA